MEENTGPDQPDTGSDRPKSRARSRSRQSLLSDADRLWDAFVERFGSGPGWPFQIGDPRAALFGTRPRIDIAERGDEIVVTAEIPGLKREDLDIELSSEMLTLRSEQSSDTQSEERGYHRREIVRGSFVRQVRLPCAVDVDNAKADYRDGMLTLTVPKAQQARGRKIPLGGGPG
jgi:HSP20 family protein